MSTRVIDWTGIYNKYPGLWVALENDEETVISAGKTLREASENAKRKGFDNPIFMQVPKDATYFVGITSHEISI